MDVVVFGYSGHAYVIIESSLALKKSVVGYVDLVEKKENPYSLRYLGSDQQLIDSNFLNDYLFVLGIGDNILRKKVYDNLSTKLQFLNTIDVSANTSSTLQLGNGNYIGKNVIVNALCKIGNATIINTASVIEHECQIGDFSHIAPGAVLCGNVVVGKNVFIGANTVIKQGVTIGDNVIIGAGSVVVKDVNSNSQVFGNPARIR